MSTEKLNRGAIGPNEHDDFVKKTIRGSRMAWVFCFILLFTNCLMALFIALRPPQYIGVEDGVPIGQVIMDSHVLRPIEMIQADFKDWVERCTSLSATHIYEDLAVCLNHMTDDLAEAKLQVYEDTNYAETVRAYGCIRSETLFDPSKISVVKDESGKFARAEIYGEKRCYFEENTRPNEQEIAVRLVAQIELKTKGLPLGFKVIEYEDIN